MSSIPPLLQMGQTVNAVALPVADGDGDAITCRMATSSESGVPSIANAPSGTLSVSSGCVLNWDATTAPLNSRYAVQVVLEATHGDATESVALDFMIEIVGGVNTPPTCELNGSGSPSLPVQVIAPGTTLNISAVGTDPEGSNLTAAAVGMPGGATFGPTSGASPLTSSFSWTPGAGDAGSAHAVSIIFTDTGFLQGLCSFSIQVSANQDPTVAADSGAVSTPEGTDAENTGTVGDADGDTVSLSASAGTVTNNGDGTWSWSNTAPDGPDSYTVTVSADDGNGGTASTTFDVTVTNVAPTVDAGADVTVAKNAVAALLGTFRDPAGTADEPYAWSWSTGDSGSAADGDTLPSSFLSTTSGVFDLTLTVEDKDGGVGSDTVRVTVVNQAPSCDDAAPSIAEIWPPNHKMVDVTVDGVTDADGDAITITIDSIFQDEPVNTKGDGNTDVDGAGVGTSTASVRAERSGSKKVPGDGRAYHIAYTASDGEDDCSGSVVVRVPHDKGKKTVFVDGGALYDSTAP